MRDKTFFFLAYEGYRQHWGFPLTGYVPSPSFRAQVAAESPGLIPILDAYPIGQTATSNPNIAQFMSAAADRSSTKIPACSASTIISRTRRRRSSAPTLMKR